MATNPLLSSPFSYHRHSHCHYHWNNSCYFVYSVCSFSGPWRGLPKCEELIRTIGSLQFAVKEKKRKAKSDIDKGTALPQASVSMSGVAKKRPLTMSTRSANVELNSSSTIRLTQLLTVQGPHTADRSDEEIMDLDSKGQCEDSDGDAADRQRKMQSSSVHPKDATRTDQSADKSGSGGVRASASACDPVSAGIVTAKSSDAILGHVLRHVEKCLTLLARNVAKTNSSSTIATNIRVSTSGGASRHAALDGSPDSSRTDNTSYENILLSRQICMCVFSLFTGYLSPGHEESTVDTPSSAATSIDGVASSNVPDIMDSHFVASTKSDGCKDRGRLTNSTNAVKEGDVAQESLLFSNQTLLSNVSERRRCQALSLATRFLLYCNKDCTRLLRDIVTMHKSRTQTCWNLGVGKGLGSRRKKRGYGFSDSEEEEAEMEKIKLKESEMEKQKGEGQCDGEEHDSDGDEMSSSTDPYKRSAPVIILPNTAAVPPMDRKDSYCFLSALLTATHPSTVINAKDWTLRKNSTSSSSSPTHASSTRQRNSGAQTASNQKNSAASGVVSEKHAHSLVFKIEELEWRLLQIRQEIDGHRGLRPVKKRKVRSCEL